MKIKVNFKKVEDAIKKGIVMIPEDRRKLGLVFTQNTNLISQLQI